MVEKPSFSNPNYENGYQNDVSRLSSSGSYNAISNGPNNPNEGATKQQVVMKADERTPLLDSHISVDVDVVPGGQKKEPSLLWVLTKVKITRKLLVTCYLYCKSRISFASVSVLPEMLL